MQTDVKSWLQTTGIEVEELVFKEPPSLPYMVFLENPKYNGADNKNCISIKEISIELYSETINTDSETKIENLLNQRAIEFSKGRTWIQEELFFQTVYDFTLIEKI